MKSRFTRIKRSHLAGGLGSLALAATLAGGALVNADQAKRAPLADLTQAEKQAIDSANHLSGAFRSVANHLLPSVVAIENRPAIAMQGNSGVQPSADPFNGQNPFKGTPFEDMFRDMHRRNPGGSFPDMPRQPSPRRGIGSGVIIDAQGIILTNNHVVEGGGEVTVRTQDGREFVATDVWTDPKTDLAVVKIDSDGDLPAAALGNSDSMEIGDWVLALGQPFGLESTVTAGIISAKHRGIGITDRENFLQTDAAINPGNSGGPLVNLHGEVIGINTAIHSRSGGNVGIGFAIPSNLARWVSDQLIEEGKVRRAYLGVGIQPVTQELARQLSVEPREGVVVTEVFDDTPAAEAGLKSGDVIVRVDGTEVGTPQALQLLIERVEIGESVTMEVVRNGETVELSFRAAEQPESFAAAPNMPKSVDPQAKPVEMIGVEVAPVDGAIAKRLGVKAKSGVLITSVKDGSPAAEAGLAPAMVITEVNRQAIESVEAFRSAIQQAREEGEDGILLLVKTENGSRFVVIEA